MGLTRDVGRVVSTDAAVQIVSFLSKLWLARILGAHEFGVLVLLWLVIDYCDKLGRLGTDEAATVLAGQDPSRYSDLLWHSLFVALVLGLIWATLLLVIRAQFGVHVLAETRTNLVWLLPIAASIPAAMVSRVAARFLLMQNDVTRFNLLVQTVPATRALFTLAGVFAVADNRLGLAIGTLLAHLSSAVLSVAPVLRARPRPERVRLDHLRSLARLGVGMFSVTVVQYLHLRVDQLLLAIIRTPAEVGVYNLGVAVADTLRKLPAGLSAILFPTAAKLSAERAGALTARASRASVVGAMAMPLVAVILMIAVVRPILGPEYRGTMLVFLLLIPGTIALAISQPAMTHFQARGKPWRLAYASFACLILNLALNLLLLPKYGIIGAALTSSISYSLLAIILLRSFSHAEGVAISDVLIPRRGEIRQLLAKFEPVRR